MSSFVKKVTYLKISKIGLDLAKKNQFEKVTDKQIDNKISKFKKIDVLTNCVKKNSKLIQILILYLKMDFHVHFNKNWSKNNKVIK